MRDEASHVLVPLEVSSVDFYGESIVVILVKTQEQPRLYVSLCPLCNFLGLAWSGQFERIQRDPVLSDALRFVRVSPKDQGGDPVVLVLPLEFLPGWLFGISVSRVHPRLHASLHRYRKECFRVLAAHFPETLLTSLLISDEMTPAIGISGIVYIAYGDGYYKRGMVQFVRYGCRSTQGSFITTLIVAP